MVVEVIGLEQEDPEVELMEARVGKEEVEFFFQRSNESSTPMPETIAVMGAVSKYLSHAYDYMKMRKLVYEHVAQQQ